MMLDTFTSDTESFNKDIDRLEGVSRRDNLRFFGLGSESLDESFPLFARTVVAALNDVQNPIKF